METEIINEALILLVKELKAKRIQLSKKIAERDVVVSIAWQVVADLMPTFEQVMESVETRLAEREYGLFSTVDDKTIKNAILEILDSLPNNKRPASEKDETNKIDELINRVAKDHPPIKEDLYIY